MPTEVSGFPLAIDAVVSMGTVTEQKREVSALRERLGQLEEERAELQENLSSQRWVSIQFDKQQICLINKQNVWHQPKKDGFYWILTFISLNRKLLHQVIEKLFYFLLH